MKNLILVSIVAAICALPLAAQSAMYDCGDDTVLQIEKNPAKVVFQKFGMHFPVSVIVRDPVMTGKTMTWRMTLKDFPACFLDAKIIFLQNNEAPPFMKNPIELHYTVTGAQCTEYGSNDNMMMCSAK